MDTGLLDPGRETRQESDRRSLAAERPPPRRAVLVRRLVIMALLLAIVFGGLYGFNRFRQNAISEFFASNTPPPTPVAAAQAVSAPAPQFLPGIGTLAAVREVMVAPEVGGRVTQIMFESGAHVRAGDPLVQLNDGPEQADLLRFRAEAKLAELSLGRARELRSKQVGPQTTVDQQQSQLDQARSEIQKMQALIAQKLIRAPFEGSLGVRQVDLGAFVNPGDPIVTLTDLDRLYLNFTVPEQARSRVSTGQAVQVTVDAFPGEVFEGRISTIEPQVSVETRAIKLQATLDNPGRRLLPGMFASAQVVLPPQPAVVTVPETAVDYTLYGDSVFLIREDGRDQEDRPVLKAVRTYVKTGERFSGRVAVLEGLKAGDLVATSGQLKLMTGAAVTLTDANALAPPRTLPAN